MMTSKKYTPLLWLWPLLLLFNCSNPKVSAPLFDGLYLQYQARSTTEMYRFSAVDDNVFEMSRIKRFGGGKDDVDEFTIDRFGRIKKSTTNAKRGDLSSIWMPSRGMKAGDTFNGDFTVIRKDRWKDWDVIVVKPPVGDVNIYYESTTGFRVGYAGKSATGEIEFVLVDTNANIPTIGN